MLLLQEFHNTDWKIGGAKLQHSKEIAFPFDVGSKYKGEDERNGEEKGDADGIHYPSVPVDTLFIF